jgi:tyrosyl-tRNA synthetase
MDQSPQERYELITRNLQEVLGAESIMKMCEEKRELSLYWVRLYRT